MAVTDWTVEAKLHQASSFAGTHLRVKQQRTVAILGVVHWCNSTMNEPTEVTVQVSTVESEAKASLDGMMRCEERRVTRTTTTRCRTAEYSPASGDEWQETVMGTGLPTCIRSRINRTTLGNGNGTSQHTTQQNCGSFSSARLQWCGRLWRAPIGVSRSGDTCAWPDQRKGLAEQWGYYKCRLVLVMRQSGVQCQLAIVKSCFAVLDYFRWQQDCEELPADKTRFVC